MPRLGTKPALALGVTAAMVMGASGVSAAREAPATGTGATTPNVRHGGGPGLGADATALAKKLGVSVADLQAAVKAVRDAEAKPDRDAEEASQAKTIADALGVEAAVVTTALEAQRPAKGERPTGTPPAGAPNGTTPPAGAPSAATPPDRPAGTTPPAGGRPGPGGPGGRGHGGPGGAGPRASADDTALVAALVKATGKDEAAVKAALEKADAVREAAHKARAAAFAKKLADKLKLDESKVATAIEAARVTPPARNAKETTSQTK